MNEKVLATKLTMQVKKSADPLCNKGKTLKASNFVE